MKVPFLDLKTQLTPIKEEVKTAINEVIDNTAFAGGPFVEKFEKEFAAFCGSKYAVGVGNGTDAIWLALLALGVGETDEVITAPSTFVATAEAISFAGADPVFVDIEPDTCNMDPARSSSAPSRRARRPSSRCTSSASPPTWTRSWRSRRSTTCWSSRTPARPTGPCTREERPAPWALPAASASIPGKNLGAFGEAGAVVTDDEELAKKIKVLRDHGQPQKYHHDVIGWNGKDGRHPGGRAQREAEIAWTSGMKPGGPTRRNTTSCWPG